MDGSVEVLNYTTNHPIATWHLCRKCHDGGRQFRPICLMASMEPGEAGEMETSKRWNDVTGSSLVPADLI